MYDFCFTYPYAIILALGGFAGFVGKGSLPSLLGGLGSAGILAACAQISLNAYHKVSPALSFLFPSNFSFANTPSIRFQSL